MMGWHRNGGDMFWGGWVMMSLLILLLAAGVAVAIWALVRSGHGSRPTPNLSVTSPPVPNTPPSYIAPASGSARAILDERFARGEIDVAEYEQRRATLEGAVTS